MACGDGAPNLNDLMRSLSSVSPDGSGSLDWFLDSHSRLTRSAAEGSTVLPSFLDSNRTTGVRRS